MKPVLAGTLLIVGALLWSGAAATQTGDDTVSTELPRYVSGPPSAGTVRCVGSSTVSNLLNRWATEFKGIYPDVEITVTGSDSNAGPPALLAGTTELAPMSRPMTAEEIVAFTAKFGYAPLKLAVAADAIAIYVEKDNPVESLSLQQIDAIFSRTMKRGGKPVSNWSDVGVKGPLGDTAIVRYAILGESGTVSVFKDMALAGGDLAFDVTRFRGSSSVVQGVGADDAGIGFASVVLKTKRTRQVPLLDKDGKPCAPTYENVLSERYPLTRLLYIYVNKPPGKPLSPVTREFLNYILSRDGQRVAAAGGNLPLTAGLVAKERAALLP